MRQGEEAELWRLLNNQFDLFVIIMRLGQDIIKQIKVSLTA